MEGSAAGDAVLRMLSRGSWTFVADSGRDPPRYWWDVEHAYRSFLAGPVATPDTVIGLLTVDALRPGELSHVDVTLVRLLADLLAAALCL